MPIKKLNIVSYQSIGKLSNLIVGKSEMRFAHSCIAFRHTIYFIDYINNNL
jgi:hypothetical protein